MKNGVRGLMALLLMPLLGSCLSDAFDQLDKNRQNYALTEVPASFDWSMSKTALIDIQVDDRFEGQYAYVVELFDENPILSDSAVLLAKGSAWSGNDFQCTLSIPDGLQSVFARQTAPDGLSTLRSATVSDAVSIDFGEVAPSTVVSMPRRMSSVVEATVTPEYAESVPSSAKEYTGQWSNNGIYYLKEGYNGSLNLGSSCVVYVAGKATVTSFYMGTGGKLFLIPGSDATITFSGNSLSQSGTVVSINTNARLIVPSLQLATSVRLFNRGGLYSQSNLQVATNGYLYNEGRLSVATTLSGENSESQILNFGVVEAKDLLLAGNSNFTNNGTSTISGSTKVNSTNAVWRNESGTFKTGTFTVSAQNPHTYNGCKLVVDGLCTLTDAKTLVVEEGASVYCASLYMNNSRVELGAGSVFQVTDEASYGYNPKKANHGFYGVDESPALLLLNKAVIASGGYDDVMHYGGNLHVECESHPALQHDPWNIIYTVESTVSWFAKGGSTLVIASGSCNDGHGTPVVKAPAGPTYPIEVDPGTVYTILCEDLWPKLGDYDMNDLVATLKPSYWLNKDNRVTSLKLTLTVKAIGAIKPLSVGLQLDALKSEAVSSVSYDQTDNLDGMVFIPSNNGTESGQTQAVIPLIDHVHGFLGVGQVVTNTKADGVKADARELTAIVQFAQPVAIEDIDLSVLNVFLVTDRKPSDRTEVHQRGKKATDKAGKALFDTEDDQSSTVPYTTKDNLIWMLMVPADLKYPSEGVIITKAYSKFKNWALKSGQEDVWWYKEPVAKYTY